VWRLLFDVFGVVMTVYMNWKHTLALMLRKKSVKRKIKQTSKQKILFLCSSECNVQFQPIKEFKLVRKKNMKK